MISFDHVILGVRDLAASAKYLANEYGLEFIPGGVHSMGTNNWVVRFKDDSYLELLGVHDATKPGGAWLSARLDDGYALIGWAVRPDSITEVALRTGYEPRDGSIELPNGERKTWQVLSDPDLEWMHHKGALPFFIEYARRLSTQEPKRSRAGGAGATEGMCWVEVGIDTQTLSDWLGHHALDIRYLSKDSGLVGVGISLGDREVVLRAADLRS